MQEPLARDPIGEDENLVVHARRRCYAVMPDDQLGSRLAPPDWG